MSRTNLGFMHEIEQLQRRLALGGSLDNGGAG
jgi:UDP-3-O-acyl-N-acetylglucosamine deacetylase